MKEFTAPRIPVLEQRDLKRMLLFALGDSCLSKFKIHLTALVRSIFLFLFPMRFSGKDFFDVEIVL